MSSGSNLKLAFVIEAIDNATKKIRAVNDAVEKSQAPLRRARAAARDLFNEAGWTKLQKQWGVINERGSALWSTVRRYAVGFAAVSAAAGGAFFGVKRTIDEIDRTNDVAKKLGMGVEQLQRMGYAAQLNGSNAEEMGQALQFLSQNMVEAINGSKESVLWFSRVGLTVQQLRKMNAAQVFEAIADKFAKVGDARGNAEKKIAVMRALMGRGGAELKQVLDLGSAGLQTFYKEAERLGAVIDGETAGAMADFNDNFDRLTFSIRGVMATIAKYALPSLDAMVKRFTEMNVSSRQALGERLGRAMGDLVTRFPAFLTSLGQISETMAKLAVASDRVAQAMGGWDNALMAIAAILGARVVIQLVAFIAACASAVPTVLGVAKIVWWLAAGLLSVVGLPAAIAVGLVAAAVAIWAYWEPISAMFVRVWGTIKAISGAAGRWIGRTFGIGGPGAPSAVAGATAPSALVPGGSQLSGKLRIYVDSEGKARVTELQKPRGGLLDFDVYSGPLMVGQ